jgi:hypothetical protein
MHRECIKKLLKSANKLKTKDDSDKQVIRMLKIR